jgi:hypothetical protein
MVACWVANFGKAAMDFKAIFLQPPKVWANQVPEPGMGVLVDRRQRQGHTQQDYLSARSRAAKNV